MTEKLIYFGLPITSSYINPELIEFFNTNKKIVLFDTDGVSSWDECKSFGDYNSAPAGYDLLIKYGFEFLNEMPIGETHQRIIVSKSLWFDNGIRRSPSIVAQLLFDISNKTYYNDYTKAVYTIGSPLVGDGVYDKLSEMNVISKLIDTKSSAQLIYEKLGSNLPLCVVIKDKDINTICETGFNTNTFNVMYALNSVYQKKLIADWQLKLCNKIYSTDRIFVAHISKYDRKEDIAEIDKNMFMKFLCSPKPYHAVSFVVIKGNQ